MTQATNGSAYELDARSGAFVNDTLAGVDGSVLGANTVPALSEKTSERRYALTLPRNRNVWAAAIGGGLLTLGVAIMGRRLWSRPSRTFINRFMRPRSARWGFAR